MKSTAILGQWSVKQSWYSFEFFQSNYKQCSHRPEINIYVDKKDCLRVHICIARNGTKCQQRPLYFIAVYDRIDNQVLLETAHKKEIFPDKIPENIKVFL